jgi:Histidine kinase-, DNA gyrase B-, and HSP90-like ATPase
VTVIQPETDLRVTAHVGRAVLAQAAQFKTEAPVVWEYVVNSLQYVDPGIQPKVEVIVKHGSITISDNGSGMDEDRLAHFFTLHGENLERRAGRIGRGKWGTGKSAAFGIANSLRVDTVRNGLRNIVSLTRAAIEESDGNAIPVNWEVRNEPVDGPNGTVITISDILLPRVDKAAIIEYIERHLSAFRGTDPEVAVNSHVCEYHSPPVSSTYRFSPNASQAEVLGDVELVIHASTRPLSDLEQGITILAGPGNLVAIERGGIEHKEFGNYLFGEIDVPALETYDTPLQPFDPSRSLTLNPKHPVVAVLLGFIGSKLEEVRQKLVAAARDARKQEEARRFAKQAQDLADLLNADFSTQAQRLRDIRAATSRPGPAAALHGAGASGDQEADLWVEGLDQPGEPDTPSSDGGSGKGNGRPAPKVPRLGHPAEDGKSVVSPAAGEGQRKRPRGGFSVAFRNLGEGEDRSIYDSNGLTIIINKDHPVVAAALRRDGIESATFRRLSYEIAFTEYAIALSYETVNRDPDMPASDVLYDIRATLRRITRAAAQLYE